MLSSLTKEKSRESKDKTQGFLQKGWQTVLTILPPLKTSLHARSPFAIDKDVLVSLRKGAQIPLTLPHHQGGHQANCSTKNMLIDSIGNFGRGDKRLALMTVNTVGKYSILSL